MSRLQKRQHETDSSSSTSDSESEESQSVGVPVTKKAAGKRPAKRRQCYIKAYSDTWSCLTSSTKGPEFVFCTVCKTQFSCGHGGRNDCKKTHQVHDPRETPEECKRDYINQVSNVNSGIQIL
eukprot:TRINITY_DN6079_c0_g1_i8.p1 TRINITY_DN6079_c0_g1~~TRINITY_DN6079_c0_g1_i8.p1  ORF type:complete len:123 (-),score=20.40 TRINITY_DN6079_c0_g1_i8:198-566(-)